MKRAIGIGLVGLALFGCSKPAPPTIVPKEAKVASVSPAGLDIVVSVEATNPNSVALTAQSFTGEATLAGKYHLATVTVQKPVTLPPKQPTVIDVPLTMPWQDVGSLVALGTSQAPVPYTVTGLVTVGGESLNIQLPYSLSGTITPQQFQAAALKSIPAIPGLTLPTHP